MSAAQSLGIVASIVVLAAACGGNTGTGTGTGTGGTSASTSSGAGGHGGASTSSTDAVTIGSGGSGTGGGDPCTALIDFETIPGGAPSDGLSVGNQFQATNGVSFGLDKDMDGKPDPGVSPVLAKVGDPATAFEYDTGGVGDTGAPGQKIGMFFLTDDGVIAGPPAPLIITYASPVSAAYGQIIDIDGQEGWTVDARDASDAVIESVVMNAGDPGTGDGIATPFSFKHATADIHSLRLRYTGAAVAAVGLAFDNFSPACDAPVIK